MQSEEPIIYVPGEHVPYEFGSQSFPLKASLPDGTEIFRGIDDKSPAVKQVRDPQTGRVSRQFMYNHRGLEGILTFSTETGKKKSLALFQEGNAIQIRYDEITGAIIGFVPKMGGAGVEAVVRIERLIL